MRYHELQEAKGNDFIIKQINADCQPYLKRVGGNFGDYPMYRGMNTFDPESPMVRRKVRLDNRRPMSSAQEKHDRYNNFFEEMFGEPFRNSLHVTGDVGMARYYGYEFVIFPIGDFNWVWSTEINDLALDIPWPSVGGFSNVPPSQEVVDQTLGDQNYTINSNLRGAIASGNEIMVRSEEYYAVKLSAFKELVQ